MKNKNKKEEKKYSEKNAGDLQLEFKLNKTDSEKRNIADEIQDQIAEGLMQNYPEIAKLENILNDRYIQGNKKSFEFKIEWIMGRA